MNAYDDGTGEVFDSATYIDYQDYIRTVSRELLAHPEWRVGQTYFNVLAALRPDISEKVRTTSIDPFYQDRRLPAFHEFVWNLW